MSVPPKSVQALSARDVAELFRQPIEPVRVAPGYQAGLVIVAFMMILLPLAYLALIVAIGYLLYWHITTNVEWIAIDIGQPRRRFYLLRIALYLALIIAGLTVIAFMIKPLFARTARKSHPYTLEANVEPKFHAFVNAIAQCVGAPAPAVIEVTCDVNAAAGFRRGIWSIFTNELSLRIGMPLVAGMNTRQLAGVIAHELGHFTQFFGLRLTYLIDRINSWFARAVYERDSWDASLDEYRQTGNGWTVLTFNVAALCVWLSRRVLWVFMMAAHAISRYALRQMEYNADAYETHLCGSDVFESTTRRMQELGAASAHVLHGVPQAHAAGRLSDNLPVQIRAAASRIPQSIQREIDRRLTQTRTAFFDTHPSLPDRIARARRINATGVFTLEKPASLLFNNFDVLCKWVTVGEYQAMLNQNVQVERLIPCENVLRDDLLNQESITALRRFFGEAFTSEHPPTLQVDCRTWSPFAHELALLNEARSAMAEHLPRAVAASRKLAEVQDEFDQAQLWQDLSRSGIRISALQSAKAQAGNAGNQSERLQHLRRQRDDLLADLACFEAAARARISAAVRLLNTPEITGRLKSAEKLQRLAQRLQPALATLESLAQQCAELRSRGRAAAVMWHACASAADAMDPSRIESAARDLHRELQSLHILLRDADYPLEHTSTRLTIGSYALACVPPPSDLMTLVPATMEFLDRLHLLRLRIMGRLALLTERVERAVGLEALEKPAQPGTPAERNTTPSSR